MGITDRTCGANLERKLERTVNVGERSSQAISAPDDYYGGRQRCTRENPLGNSGDLRTRGEMEAEAAGAVLAGQFAHLECYTDGQKCLAHESHHVDKTLLQATDAIVMPPDDLDEYAVTVVGCRVAAAQAKDRLTTVCDGHATCLCEA